MNIATGFCSLDFGLDFVGAWDLVSVSWLSMCSPQLPSRNEISAGSKKQPSAYLVHDSEHLSCIILYAIHLLNHRQKKGWRHGVVESLSSPQFRNSLVYSWLPYPKNESIRFSTV